VTTFKGPLKISTKEVGMRKIPEFITDEASRNQLFKLAKTAEPLFRERFELRNQMRDLQTVAEKIRHVPKMRELTLQIDALEKRWQDIVLGFHRHTINIGVLQALQSDYLTVQNHIFAILSAMQDRGYPENFENHSLTKAKSDLSCIKDQITNQYNSHFRSKSEKALLELSNIKSAHFERFGKDHSELVWNLEYVGYLVQP
jgi:hypothetical protein